MGNRKLVATVAGACTLGLMAGVGATAFIGAASASNHKIKAKYEITLNGANEPGGGDPNGTGTSKVKVKGEIGVGGQVCVGTKKVLNVALPSTGHHIHSGVAGVNGPIVVPLAVVTSKKPGKPGKSAKLCGTTSEANLISMRDNPAAWYVNVHSSEFPGGAIRAQFG